jgi:hypothetical protein
MSLSDHSLHQGQAPTPIKPAGFDASVISPAAVFPAAAGAAASAPKATAAETHEHAKQRLAAATAKLLHAQEAKAATVVKLAEAEKDDAYAS